MKFKIAIPFLVAVTLISYSCSIRNRDPKPYGPLPSKQQLAWQEMEYYMFIHFGPNTFTDKEWGTGKENPLVFNPSNVNTDQWARTAKAAGMKGIILTAKHHDGFCLWPSKYSTHTVRESSWRQGRGDLLKELSVSCKKYGLKFGVYLSPWDQNHPSYNTPAYNQIFANTLGEVLNNYGKVFEQWFDGANDGTSRQVYDWQLFNKTVFKYQPEAIIFSGVGPGARWIGNERGYAGKTNWSRLNTEGHLPGKMAPSKKALNEGEKDGAYWLPGEVDVSIRPGWFYIPSTDDKVKTVDQLMDIYLSSVGRNSNLLLNVPPDRTGQINVIDSLRLMEFRKAIDRQFEKNIAVNAEISTSNVRLNNNKFRGDRVLDGNPKSYWATDDGTKQASIELKWNQIEELNRIVLQEPVHLGQRIEAFTLYYWNEKSQDWAVLAKETTIGYKRILRTKRVKTSKLKLFIERSLAEPMLSTFAVYNSPEVGEYESSTLPKLVKKKKDGIILALKPNETVSQLIFTPYPSEKEVTVQRYRLFWSVDQHTWQPITEECSFANIQHNPIAQEIMLPKSVIGGFLKLQPIELTDSDADMYYYLSFHVLADQK